MPFGLSNETVDQIRSVFARHPEVRQAILYGSRAMGTHRDASDTDLALTGQDLNLAILARIETELDDLLLPWQFDLSIRSQIKTESLLNHMERVGVLFYERENKTEGNPPGGAGKEGWEVKRLGEVCEILDNRRKPITKRDRKPGPYPYYGATGVQDYVAEYLFDEPLVLIGEDGAKWDSGETTAYHVSGRIWVNNHAHVVKPYPRILDNSWLVYYFTHSDLKEFVSGLTVPKLNQASLRSIPIPLPPLPEQKRIVALLDEAFAGIATAKANAEKNLQNARALFESHLNAVFSQRGEGWVETKLGDVCQFVGGSQPPKSVFSKTKSTDNIRLIQIRDYKSDKHLVYIPRAKARRFCSADDVMIGRYGPPLFQILRGLDGAYNVALMKAVPDESKLSRDFLFYFLKHSTILEYVIYHSNRAAGQIGVTKETLEPYPIALPSLSEQKKVVAKLETLSAETQRLAGVYERKLAALEALKKSLLQRAFAGEL